MGDLDSSNFTQPWNISIINYNGTDHLLSKFAPPWVSSPTVRGTFDILESCIFTLIACIFTALHLDVVSNPTWQRLLFEKAKWVLLTILIPEVSILTATRQYLDARDLKSDLQKIQKQQKSSKSSPDADVSLVIWCFATVDNRKIVQNQHEICLLYHHGRTSFRRQ